MEDDEHAVARELEVLLDVVGAELEGEIVGGERVLGWVPGGAAMGDGERRGRGLGAGLGLGGGDGTSDKATAAATAMT